MAGRIINNKEEKRLPLPVIGKVKVGELATSSTGKTVHIAEPDMTINFDKTPF